MVYTSFGPQWFSGAAITFEFIFMLITGMIAYRSYKCWKFTKLKESLIFTASFSLFFLSYFTQTIVNLLNTLNQTTKIHALSGLNTMCNQISQFAPVGNLSYYTHMILTLIGLILLVYLTFEVKNKKLLSLMIVVIILSILTSFNAIGYFYFLTTLFYLFIVEFYSRKKKTMTFLGFTFLLMGNLSFIFIQYSPTIFLIGHIFTLIGYLMLANLLRTTCKSK